MQELLWSRKQKQAEPDRGAELRAELQEVQRELLRAEEIFNSVTEDELLEACIYRIHALKAYRDYLLRTARERERLRAGAAVPIA